MNEKPEATKTELTYLFACLITETTGLGLMAYSLWTHVLTGAEQWGVFFGGATLMFVGFIFVIMLKIECKKIHGDLTKR